VRHPFLFVSLLFAVTGLSVVATGAPPLAIGAQAQSSPATPAQQQSTPTPPGTEQATPPQAPAAAPVHVGPVIVLDPAHGGTDSGARGNGIAEKDLVLEFARTARMELERQGFRVVLTRNDDSNPSYDDRAAIANAYRDALFVTIHVSSTGNLGTARAYYYQFGSPLSATATTPAVSVETSAGGVPAPGGLLVWEEAQRSYVEASHRLADLLQSELAQRFAGSPTTSTPVAVRELRSVAAPAVGVEISSVVVSDPVLLRQLVGPLTASIVRSAVAFHQSNSTGGK
jgi:N-acetylmuramoyl-L-alanine amidase